MRTVVVRVEPNRAHHFVDDLLGFAATGGYRRLYSRHVTRQASRYRPMLTGVGPRPEGGQRPLYPTRGTSAGTRCPVLTPAQVQQVLDGCCVPAGSGTWSGSLARLRDRLLFATLAHTGMRLGEALSLRHHDVHVGAGDTPYVEVVPRQDHPHGARVVRRSDPTNGRVLLQRRPLAWQRCPR